MFLSVSINQHLLFSPAELVYSLFIPENFQIDLVHIHANQSNEDSSDHVEEGIDLTEYYINVEWDILRVPAERHVKVYACCPEPYPGTSFFPLPVFSFLILESFWIFLQQLCLT